MQRNLSTYALFAAACALAALPACLDDKSLGDVDGDGSTETTHASTQGTTDATTGTSTGTGSGTTSSPSGSETAEASTDAVTAEGSSSVGTTAQTDSSESSVGTTAGVPQLCADMVPPPLECEPHGDTSFVVEGDELPEGVDQPCTVVAAEPVDEFTHLVALECDEIEYELTLGSTISNLFVEVLEAGESVLVTAAIAEYSAHEGLPSFVLRHPETGMIRLAHINTLRELDDVDLSPIVITALESGCEYDDVDEGCDEGSITAQRVSLAFEGPSGGTVSVFDGQYGSIPEGSQGIGVIVNRAERIVCWDEACHGDDSGPFDVTQVLLLPNVGE